MPKPERKVVPVRLDVRVADKLDALAKREGSTRQAVLEKAALALVGEKPSVRGKAAPPPAAKSSKVQAAKAAADRRVVASPALRDAAAGKPLGRPKSGKR